MSMMQNRKVSVAVVGMGGYGETYVNAVLDHSEDYGMECIGMVDIHPEACNRLEEVQEKGIPVYPDLEALYQAGVPELVFMATPIYLHRKQACFALEQGSNVLCEKPAAGCMKDVEIMAETAKRCNRFLSIGFQRSYDDTILAAKADVLAGKYGKPLKYKLVTVGGRDQVYYSRHWAGKLKIGEEYVCDSIANNAAAHGLNNLLFMAGETMHTAAYPECVEAECYRGNQIENFDTITLRGKTENGVEIYFAASHCVKESVPRAEEYLFEKGRIVDEGADGFNGYPENGEKISYGRMNTGTDNKIICAVKAVRGEDTIYSDIVAAGAHSKLIQMVQDSVTIREFGDKVQLLNLVDKKGRDRWTNVAEGIEDALAECYEKELLLSEVNYF